MADDIRVDHRLSADDATVHHAWDPGLDPVLSVEPGDAVEFECRDATDDSLGPGATMDDVLSREFEGHPLTGPVAVEGVEPGDVLAVSLLSFEHRGIGFTYFYPGERGAGLLPDEFPGGALHVWDLEDDVGHFVNGIEVPLDPFPGNLGVAPAADGPQTTVPPRRVGGNLDVKHLTAGSTLYLPVEVDGGMFSIGDCHGAQGDGEVCVTGIEAPMTVTARLDVAAGKEIEQPQFETGGPFTPTGRDEPMYATTGIADDLMDATRSAIRHMIDHLEAERGLTRAEAYLLCSVAVDLKINEVVDAPNWVVSAYLADSLFPS